MQVVTLPFVFIMFDMFSKNWMENSRFRFRHQLATETKMQAMIGLMDHVTGRECGSNVNKTPVFWSALIAREKKIVVFEGICVNTLLKLYLF